MMAIFRDSPPPPMACLSPPPLGAPPLAGMVERVRRLLTTDNDPQVVANCLSVLLQVRSGVRGVRAGWGSVCVYGGGVLVVAV